MIIGSRIFGGIAPRFPARQLKPPYAETAENIKMERGQLRAYAAPVPAFVGKPIVAGAKTVVPYDKKSGETILLSWPDEVDAVVRPIPNDSQNRVYWTGDSRYSGAPRMADELAITGGTTTGTFPKNSYMLGVPAPTGMPLLERIKGADVPDDPEAEGWKRYYRSYTYTFVDKYKQESAPYADANGAPLTRILVYEGDKVEITGIQGAPVGGVNFDDGLIRVYQTDITGNLVLAAELPAGTTTVTIDHMEVNGIICRTLQTEPADSRMRGITLSTFGFMYGFFDNTLCMSDRLMFHSWPSLYQRTTPTKILGVFPSAQGAIVLCEGGVYLAFGSDPANVNIVPIDETKGCVARATIVDMGGYVMYASHSGVVVCSGQAAEVVTSDVILDLDWATYSPSTMKAFRHKERYFIYNDNYGFVLNPSASEDKLTSFTFRFDGGFTYEKDSNWYYVDGTGIKKFDSDSSSPSKYKWRSALDILDSPAVFTCVRLDVDDCKDVKVNVYVDGLALFPDGVTLNPSSTDKVVYFRLPPYRPSREYSYSIEGTSPVNSMYLSTSLEELKRGAV